MGSSIHVWDAQISLKQAEEGGEPQLGSFSFGKQQETQDCSRVTPQ